MRRAAAATSVAAAALLGLLGPGLPALAQGATPAAGLGEAVDPAECRVAPRSADEMVGLWFAEDAAGTPVLATPAPPPPPAAVPLGVPADAETAAAVAATVREFLACINLGENGRTDALFSDAAIRRFGPPPDPAFAPADVPAYLAGLPEPVPPGERLRLLAVADVAVVTDGRVGALVTSDDPTLPSPGPETALYLFVEERGRWVVDAVLSVLPPEEGATPPPA
jgi:hypothetical protein